MAEEVLTVQDADDCVQEVARTFESMSYSELRGLAATPEGQWSVLDRSWRGIPIRLTIQVRHYGLLWRRASVEIVASAEGDSSWPWTPCVYMQRYPSGRLWKGRTKGTKAPTVKLQTYLVQLLIYAATAGAILVLARQCACAP